MKTLLLTGGTERRREQEEEKRSNVATIAIIACSVVMVLAIVVFLVVLFNGKPNTQAELVTVPNLLGEVYEEANYPDFEIKLNDKVYDETYAAGQIIEQNPKAGDKVEKGKAIFVNVSLGPIPKVITMPDLTDKKLEDAERALVLLSLNLQIEVLTENHDTIKENNVIRSEPVFGTELEAGQGITLYVSEGVKIDSKPMPDVVGDKQESAQRILESQELDLDIVVEEEYDSVVAVGEVIRTDPEQGASLKTGQKVTLYVSKGPKTVVMKNIIGLSVDRAVSILNADEFTKYELEHVESEAEKDTVIELKLGDQTIQPGDKVDVNAQIIVVVSKGPAAAPQVTKNVTIGLRNSADIGECQVVVMRDGTEVFRQTVAQGVNSVELKDQVGSGTVYYEVVINDSDGWIEKVPF